MQAMVLRAVGRPLEAVELDPPALGPGQVRLQVQACGVCRTDLHIVDGELAEPKLPLVLGHQIVASVSEVGPGADRFRRGERVGVPWLAWTDETCRYCRSGRENLCDHGRFTGYTVDGGMRRRRSRTSATASRCRRRTPTCTPRRSCARG